MGEEIPSQCPECGAISVHVSSVPPQDHHLGEEWATRVRCEECGDYYEWFE